MNESRYDPDAGAAAEPDDPYEPGDFRADGRIPTEPRNTRRLGGARFLATGAVLVLGGAVGVGVWQHLSLHAQVLAAAEQRQSFVPSVRTAAVRASDNILTVSWPGTTEAFAQANIYARASGYISRREVDIGSRVNAGQLLVEITAP